MTASDDGGQTRDGQDTDDQGGWLAATLADQLGVDGALPTDAVVAAAIHPRYHRQLLMASEHPEALARLLAQPPRVSPAAAVSLGFAPTSAGGPHDDPQHDVGGSTGALTRRATTAAVRWAASGFGLADEPTRERRLAACAACPHRTVAPDRGAHRVTRRLAPDATVCGLCGCVTALKVRLASEACPAAHPDDPTLTRWEEPLMPTTH